MCCVIGVSCQVMVSVLYAVVVTVSSPCGQCVVVHGQCVVDWSFSHVSVCHISWSVWDGMVSVQGMSFDAVASVSCHVMVSL